MDAIVQVREITDGSGLKPRVPDFVSTRLPLARKFIKFCLVGGSGLAVDMIFLFLFADPRCLGLNIVLSKIFAAEMAMINNFIWNELWTFRKSLPLSKHYWDPNEAQAATLDPQPARSHRAAFFHRFLLFHVICGIGIGIAVLLLHLFHTSLSLNLYLSNLLAIIIVTVWNFGMNAVFNWERQCR